MTLNDKHRPLVPDPPPAARLAKLQDKEPGVFAFLSILLFIAPPPSSPGLGPGIHVDPLSTVSIEKIDLERNWKPAFDQV